MNTEFMNPYIKVDILTERMQRENLFLPLRDCSLCYEDIGFRSAKGKIYLDVRCNCSSRELLPEHYTASELRTYFEGTEPELEKLRGY